MKTKRTSKAVRSAAAFCTLLLLFETVCVVPALAEEPAAGSVLTGELPSAVFSDVPGDVWFAPYISFAVENGMISGYEDGTFAPNANITRGDFLLALWRIEGSPIGSSEAVFEDVPAESVYFGAAAWASEKKIAKGYAGKFDPDEDITRQDLSTLVLRYADSIGFEGKTAPEDENAEPLAAFPDCADVADYASHGMGFCTQNGIISGSSGKLLPKDNATRAEGCAMLKRIYENVALAAKKAEKTVSLEKKDVRFYKRKSTDYSLMPLYFENGSQDIPYIEAADAFRFMEDAMTVANDFPPLVHCDGFSFDSLAYSGEKYTAVRGDHSAEIDFENGVITFSNINGFTTGSLYAQDPLDIVCVPGYDEKGNPRYLTRNSLSGVTVGSPTVIELTPYHIKTYYIDGKGYLPFQTFVDFMVTSTGCFTAYNGSAVFLFGMEDMKDEKGEKTEIMRIYCSGTDGSVPIEGGIEKDGQRSPELAEFCYNELCLVLDHQYGLKKDKGIESFFEFFADNNTDEALRGEDTYASYGTLTVLSYCVLEDLHTSPVLCSPLCDEEAATFFTGLLLFDAPISDRVKEYLTYNAVIDAYRTIGHGVGGAPGYEEYGDTAFVTFDEFDLPSDEKEDLYRYPAGICKDADNSIALIAYANSQIKRKGSPIKNVVLDLSGNGGGAVDAGAYVLSWFLGEGTLHNSNPFNGGASSVSYLADVNCDGKLDDRDNVSSLNLFCIISPATFSCANLTAAGLRESGRVTLIGKRSGGGACAVLPLSLADGTLMSVSSALETDMMVDGEYVSVEYGIEPDIVLSEAQMTGRQYVAELVRNCVKNK